MEWKKKHLGYRLGCLLFWNHFYWIVVLNKKYFFYYENKNSNEKLFLWVMGLLILTLKSFPGSFFFWKWEGGGSFFSPLVTKCVMTFRSCVWIKFWLCDVEHTISTSFVFIAKRRNFSFFFCSIVALFITFMTCNAPRHSQRISEERVFERERDRDRAIHLHDTRIHMVSPPLARMCTHRAVIYFSPFFFSSPSISPLFFMIKTYSAI